MYIFTRTFKSSFFSVSASAKSCNQDGMILVDKLQISEFPKSLSP